MVNYDIMVRTQATPNPSAMKFVVNCEIKAEGKATFDNPEQAKQLKLAEDLFLVKGVEQLHMFENVVTVSFEETTDKDSLVEEVSAVLKTRLPIHNPKFLLENEIIKKKKKENMSPDVEKIEEILDRTVRPGLQADGGDITVVEYKDKTLTVTYEGACGSCPSAMYGTLDAIYSILRAEFDPELDIMIA